MTIKKPSRLNCVDWNVNMNRPTAMNITTNTWNSLCNRQNILLWTDKMYCYEQQHKLWNSLCKQAKYTAMNSNTNFGTVSANRQNTLLWTATQTLEQSLQTDKKYFYEQQHKLLNTLQTDKIHFYEQQHKLLNSLCKQKKNTSMNSDTNSWTVSANRQKILLLTATQTLEQSLQQTTYTAMNSNRNSWTVSATDNIQRYEQQQH